MRIHASSGTTGKPKIAGYTRNDLALWGECVARAMASAGQDSKSVIQVAYGYGLFTGGLGAHIGAETIGATVLPMSSGNTKKQIMFMQDMKSTALACTPSYALTIAEGVAKAGIDPADLSLQSGIFGAEPWTEGMRKDIEKGLGIKAYDIYGLTEIVGPGVSISCDAHNGMHIQEDYFYPEIIDPETLEPLPDGEIGELVFTTLGKEGFPMIRYRTRDLCYLMRDKCACGRTTVRMSKILGRTDDMLIIRGVNVFPSQIETVISKFEELTINYMIYVGRENNKDTFDLEVELAPGLAIDNIKFIEDLRSRLDHAFERYAGNRLARRSSSTRERCLEAKVKQLESRIPESCDTLTTDRGGLNVIKQMSVFVENTTGRLADLTKILADNDIDIKASTIADTVDFGILRCIVPDPEAATKILKAAGFTASITEVVAVSIEDSPGDSTRCSRYWLTTRSA